LHPHFGSVGDGADRTSPAPVDLLHPRPRDAPRLAAAAAAETAAAAHALLPPRVQRQLGSLKVGLAADSKPEDLGRLRYV
jgi:hypothetical protein